MLTLLGRSGAERAKSIAIGLLAVLLMLALWQVWTENGPAAARDHDRQAATDIARRFAIALTTYDYAHLNVHLAQIAAVCTAAVSDRIAAASGDVIAAKASSQGEAKDSLVMTITAARVEMLVTTSQVVTGYGISGIWVAGLLDITVGRSGGGWLVTDYRWLLAPSAAP